MKPRRTLISAAVALAVAVGPAHAVLERLGPVDKSPTVGGFPAWAQDRTGITMDFCDLKSQAELDGGWCVLIPPGPVVPEAFPGTYFDEHFYYRADNGLNDAANGFRARLVIAFEAAFANGAPVDGDQMVFGRVRVLFIPGCWSMATTGGHALWRRHLLRPEGRGPHLRHARCRHRLHRTFDCALNSPLGPYLPPSPTAGGGEVPPMPDLIAAPPGSTPSTTR
jgi:hypothetical protein